MPTERTIYVQVPMDEPEFDSWKGAVDFSAKTARCQRARSDTLRIQGQRILSVTYTDTSLRLVLSGDRSVRCYLNDDMTDWTLEKVCSAKPTTDPPRLEPIRLVFPKTDEFLWDRNAMADTLTGSRLKMISASPSCVFLYTDAPLDIMVSRLVDEHAGQSILFFDEE